MKKLLTTTLMAIFCLGMNAQTPDWQWAKSAIGSGDDRGRGISTDANGNVYVTGHFSSSTITFGTTTLTNAGTGNTIDIFIVKYDASGNVLWAKSAGGTGSDYGYGLTTDAVGNLYVTGAFYSPSITFGTTTLTNAGGTGYKYDIYVVKYDPTGNVLWAKSAGGTGDDNSSCISTDANGNVYITGTFSSSTITFGSTTLTSKGNIDIFIVKYDAFGNILWAKSAGSTGDDFAYGISTDASGNVYITGMFASPSIAFGTTTLTGNDDVFVVKYDATGNVLWARSAGGSSDEIGASISSDASGNVYVTGFYISSSFTFGTTTLTNKGGWDIFVVKYDSLGNVLWARSEGSTGDDRANSIASDASGNAYVTGYYGGTTITFGTTTLTKPGFYIVKYNASGNVLWAKSADGTGGGYGMGISTDQSGNAYVTGYYNSSTITFGTSTLTNSGGIDIFIAKLGFTKPPSIVITSNPASQTKCLGNPVTFSVTATGNNLNYQWKKNGTAINGAIADTFNISSVSLADSGLYTCTISDTGYSVTSNGAKLTINTIHSITSPPANTTKCVGQTALFSVTANGLGISYQWRKGGANISGATKSAYTITSVSTADYGNYDVVVSGSCAAPVISNTATLTVNSLPSITTQPANDTKCVGQTASFSVSAAGTGITYQWKKNGTDISGAISSSYSITTVTASDAGNYTVVVSGTCTPAVTSNAASLTVNTKPAVTTHPANGTKKEGETATFSVSANGGTLTYQWQKNGTNISGATSASYSRNNLLLSDSGNYSCIVTNSCGSDTSNVANLHVDKKTGIRDSENEKQFSIYPNPSSGLITIETTAINISTDLQIFDIHGHEVLKKRISEPTTTINISHLPQGLYYISLKGQKSVYFEKIVKQ